MSSSTTLTLDPRPDSIMVDVGCTQVTLGTNSDGSIKAHGVTIDYNALTGSVRIKGDVQVSHFMQDGCLSITVPPPAPSFALEILSLGTVDDLIGYPSPRGRSRSILGVRLPL